MKKLYFSWIFIIPIISFTQIKINESSNANHLTIENNQEGLGDWFELYNPTNIAFNLFGYKISDNRDFNSAYPFGNFTIDPNAYAVFLANGEGIISTVDHYETAVWREDIWRYFVPTAPSPNNWQSLTFNDGAWLTSQLSVGFGDGDDFTDLGANINSVLLRKSFNVTNKDAIIFSELTMDYDDGFVAYLNGVEVARVGLQGNPPAWDEVANQHEALIYQNQDPEHFVLDSTLVASLLINGTNVLAIQVNNAGAASSDLTSIAYLTFGFSDNVQYYGNGTHPYFNIGGGGNLASVNFTLKNKGEGIYLFDPSGQIVDSLIVPDLHTDHSFGCTTDGSVNKGIFAVPTPGTSNNPQNSYLAYLPKPTITFPSGKYTSAQSLTIVNNDPINGQLHYTLDGQTPTNSDPVFVSPTPISVSTFITVRNVPTNPQYLPSETTLGTYLINDPTTLAIVSISTDQANLTGPTGIFDNNQTDWRRPCVIDYIGTDGQWKFSTLASIKPDGGAGGSRTNPQHSVTIQPANNALGSGEPIEYPLIPEKPYVEKYDAFYLRNGSNYWNTYPLKDASMMRITKGLNTNYQAYTPVTVFLNGEYFGVYELREKANNRYFEQNYGNDMDSLDLCSISYFYGADIIRPVDGSDESYYAMVDSITSFSPTAPDFLKKSGALLDLKNFTDYMICENWFANFDWLYNNMKFARTRTFDNKWKFFLQDMELGLGNGWGNPGSNLFDHIAGNNNTFTQMYNALLANSEYQRKFINRFADIMNTNFRQSVFQPKILAMRNEIQVEMERQYTRWTGNPTGDYINFQNFYTQFSNELNDRNPQVRSQIVNHFNLVKQVNVTLNVQPAGAGYIKISTIVPETLPWTGVYFDGNPVEITAVANPGYTFQNWLDNGSVSNMELLVDSLFKNIANNSTFVAVFEGSTTENVVEISEIAFHPDSTQTSGDWIELYNNSDEKIRLAGWKLKASNHWESFSFDDEAFIPARSYLVIAEDLTAFNTMYPNVPAIQSENIRWSNNKDSILLYNGQGSLMTSVYYSDEWLHGKIADGFGRTLERQNFTDSVGLVSSWKSGCIAGSPSTAFVNCEEDLTITEIAYNTNFAGDWFEIKNTTNSSIDLSQYRYKIGKKEALHSFSSTSLGAGEYLVVYQNSNFESYHKNINNKEQNTLIDLDSNSAVRIYLNNEVVASIRYEAQAPWDLTPSSANYTLALEENQAGEAPNWPEHWTTNCIGGSPGRNIFVCSEIVAGELFGLFPNPTSSVLNASLLNQSEDDIEIEIFDITGQIVYRQNIDTQLGEITISMDLEQLQHGVYYFRMKQGSKVDQKPFVMQ